MKLTDAQARTLHTLLFGPGMGPEATFYPNHVFPCRDNVDNGHRRNCRSLERLGLLLPTTERGQYRLAPNAREAWEAWHEKRGFKLHLIPGTPEHEEYSSARREAGDDEILTF